MGWLEMEAQKGAGFMTTHTVYILPDNGGAPVQREVIFVEELDKRERIPGSRETTD